MFSLSHLHMPIGSLYFFASEVFCREESRGSWAHWSEDAEGPEGGGGRSELWLYALEVLKGKKAQRLERKKDGKPRAPCKYQRGWLCGISRDTGALGTIVLMSQPWTAEPMGWEGPALE